MIKMEIIQADASGRLCIPKRLLSEFGLTPGMRFQIATRGNEIILTQISPSDENYEDIPLDDLMDGDEHDTLEEWSQLQEKTIEPWDEKQGLIKWGNSQNKT
jgi:bifunctional DNA-binding transcriptional regulator/antitoxin component of YhaV-PrlF toxin-antitoxin module